MVDSRRVNAWRQAALILVRARLRYELPLQSIETRLRIHTGPSSRCSIFLLLAGTVAKAAREALIANKAADKVALAVLKATPKPKAAPETGVKKKHEVEENPLDTYDFGLTLKYITRVSFPNETKPPVKNNLCLTAANLS